MTPVEATAQALAAGARAATDARTLAFLVCNETRQLLPFRLAALFVPARRGGWRLHTHSGLAVLDERTPYRLWLESLVARVAPALDAPRTVGPGDLGDAAADWDEWLPAGVLLLPLRGPEDSLAAVWLVARDTAWALPPPAGSAEAALLALAAVYGHAWWAWERPRRRGAGARALRWAPLLALGLLALPVRESALAPAEVTAVDAQVITAPQDGVVRAMRVAPNTAVRAGDVLLELDDTVLANRRGVTQEALRTARADLLQAEQKAFDDAASRAEVAVLRGKVAEREAELESLGRQLERLAVRAPADGLFIYGESSDWAGRPVQTGERVGLLADPARLGLTAWLPVADAINLEPGAGLTLYLHVAPLTPLDGRLSETSYQAVVSPEGVASYRVRGELDDAGPARIGLKGTAKIYGGRVPLAYLVFRRPLAALRTACGC
ncbi:MAG: biotin/lipoyl-binding protein [Gammaproteobacteria bacterium]|nr:biotin/lipoyl-binding protein [Gammaproteobacteria bacterium]